MFGMNIVNSSHEYCQQFPYLVVILSFGNLESSLQNEQVARGFLLVHTAANLRELQLILPYLRLLAFLNWSRTNYLGRVCHLFWASLVPFTFAPIEESRV